MKETLNRKGQARTLRIFRKLHRYTGATLFAFFFVVSISSVLLGWKKNSAGYIMAKSFSGTSSDFSDWLTVDSLYILATGYLRDSVDAGLSNALDRMDIRKEKGMVKFIFSEHFTGLQLDGATGRLLHVEQRRSDFIEKIHDGSIVDHYLGTNGYFKLFYTSLMGLALLLFTVTGFWLWYGPKRMRRH
jgi:uncharacterized iron-regulated membrane protein